MEEIFAQGGPLAIAAGFVVVVILSGRVITRHHHDEVLGEQAEKLERADTAYGEMVKDRDYWREQTLLLLPTTREAIQVAERRRTRQGDQGEGR